MFTAQGYILVVIFLAPKTLNDLFCHYSLTNCHPKDYCLTHSDVVCASLLD